MTDDAKTIIRKISARTGVPVDEIFGRSRKLRTVRARQRAQFALRKAPLVVRRPGNGVWDGKTRSYPMIARFWGAHHTSVMLNVRKEAARRGSGEARR